MSTVMYAFRANSDYHFAQQVAIVRDINSKRRWSDGQEELQTFATSIGIVWRVLESGYGIENELWKDSEMFPTCNYDDRADVPDGDINNKAIAEEIDQLIANEDYGIIQLTKEEK